MKAHLTKMWSWYLLAASIIAPYAPMVNGAITQALSSHPHIIAAIGGLIAWIGHRLPTPSSVA